ncbi:hypothetical protein BJP36_39260 [Moorena producens JHB]|uniref:Uncharacterized protein n=1 Tax=Moorena producens (strain JHB) TaxID=1454205 RepID=A0A9Q9SUY8_MOOP1|nr:hypothetical protein [Moorena producens]WAN70097.1 hypothetical protein BJP36_39260 [Moorena producens JHB]
MGRQRGLGEAARSWGSPPLAIAVVPPTRYCRGFPHSLLHQDNVLTVARSAIPIRADLDALSIQQQNDQVRPVANLIIRCGKPTYALSVTA